jgi:hypothetical protein
VDGKKTLKAQSPKRDLRRGPQNAQQVCYCKIYPLKVPFFWDKMLCQWAIQFLPPRIEVSFKDIMTLEHEDKFWLDTSALYCPLPQRHLPGEGNPQLTSTKNLESANSWPSTILLWRYVMFELRFTKALDVQKVYMEIQ